METNPGSDKAIEEGCNCPVIDNHNGSGTGQLDKENRPLFWINADCHLHGMGKIFLDVIEER